MEDNCVRSNDGIITNGDVANDLGAGVAGHSVANGWIRLAVLRANSHLMKDAAFSTDLGASANDNAVAVDKDGTFTDLGSMVDLDPRDQFSNLQAEDCQRGHLCLIQTNRQAIEAKRMPLGGQQ
jgi:hypothetical protein